MTAQAKPIFLEWLDFVDFAVNYLKIDPNAYLNWTLLDFDIVKKNIIDTYKKKMEVENKNMENIISALAKIIYSGRG